jgi:hypothetical protein
LKFKNPDRKQHLRSQAGIFVLGLCFSGSALAGTIRVPADQPTVQGAINAAQNGDIVLVSPGTYFENINFMGKAITVKSTTGPSTTVIDGGKKGSVVTFNHNEDNSSVLDGFTIQHGQAIGGLGEGGGIAVVQQTASPFNGAAPIIQNNVITQNSACGAGGGVAAGFSSPIIRNNTISLNSQFPGCLGGVGGGGVSVRGYSNTQLTGNLIVNNSWATADGGGIQLFSPGATLVQNNIIAGNSAAGSSTGPFGNNGGGLDVTGRFTNAAIVQNLIYGNSANHGGGVYFFDAPAAFINNTVADNDSSRGGSALYGYFTPAGATIANNLFIAKPGESAFGCDTTFNSPYFKNDVTQALFAFNDVFSTAGSNYVNCTDLTGTFGNISADPQFLDPVNDFHLQSTSPAIDAGNNYAGLIPAFDLDGRTRIFAGNGNGTPIIDLGVYELSSPDFTMSSLSPHILNIPSDGSSPPVSFQISPVDGFDGQVTLSCGQLPAGTACSFSPSDTLNLLSGAVQASVTISTAGASVGIDTIAIVASSTGVSSKKQLLPLIIYPTYSLMISKPVLSVLPGRTAVLQGQVASTNGYPALVTIQCGAEQPSTCTPLPAAVVPSVGGTPFAVTVGAPALGDYPFFINAVGSDRLGISVSSPVDLKVVDFNITNVLPSSISVQTGSSSPPLVFDVTAAGPFASAITLSCSGPAINAGATCAFSPSNIVNPRANSPVFVSLIVNSNGAGTGTSTVVVTASSSDPAGTKTVSFDLTISPNSGTADLSLGLTHIEAGAIPVGRTVTFSATVQNSVAASSVPAVMVMHFSQPLSLVQNIPAGCTPHELEMVCSFTVVNGNPTILQFPITAPFVRDITVTATVSSPATSDGTPGDNVATDTVPVRPRPFTRPGLPVRIP